MTTLWPARKKQSQLEFEPVSKVSTQDVYQDTAWEPLPRALISFASSKCAVRLSRHTADESMLVS